MTRQLLSAVSKKVVRKGETVNDDKKTTDCVYKWAIITQHPWLPTRADQVARARAWGIEKATIGNMDVSPLIEDDVRKAERTTNWMGKLKNRVQFLEQLRAYLKQGDPVEAQVFFATTLCVGFTSKVAEETIRMVWAAGADVYVHSLRDNGSAIYREGDDLTGFLKSVELAQNAAHQKKFKKST